MLALNEKVAAIREYEKRPVYKRIGRMFQCSPDQIKRIVQQKDAILNAWEQRTRKCRDAKTLEMKVVKVSMLGKAVYEWIRRMMYYKDILITDGLIQKMALQFKSAMGLQNFFPHQEWCDKFRSIYNIFTCDSKMLNIGYAQGHSVQIKDVMKDVLSECSPEPEDDDDMDNDLDDDEVVESGATGKSNGGGQENGENDCIDIDSDDDEETLVKAKLRKKLNDKAAAALKKQNNHDKPKTSTTTVQMMQTSQLQGIRQLMALPIQTTGLPGMSQKVLVATPIVKPGQKPGSTPMTMTIIPLATLAQPSNNISSSTSTIATAATSTNFSRVTQDKDLQVVVPPPMVEIKKEIKEEPKDGDEVVHVAKQVEEPVKIKKEYLTDDEEGDLPTKTPIKMPTLQPATSTHIVAIPIANKDMLEESTNDSLDDLTLSSLRKRIKTEETSSNEEETVKSNSPPPLAKLTATAPSTTQTANQIPPMPPLTKAPTINQTTAASSSVPTSSSSSTKTSAAAATSTPSNRSNHKSSKSTDNGQQQQLSAIRSCAEARKYLKLLEDFALERENFRLIGLITRADEVLRELDRKENNEDEDVDID